MSERIQVLIIAGVAGAGKTTVGHLLAADLGWDFCEGDDYHPAGNLKKMEAGVPLTDEDRWPWLQALKSALDQAIREERSLVVACSLLKESYRKILINDPARADRWELLDESHSTHILARYTPPGAGSRP